MAPIMCQQLHRNIFNKYANLHKYPVQKIFFPSNVQILNWVFKQSKVNWKEKKIEIFSRSIWKPEEKESWHETMSNCCWTTITRKLRSKIQNHNKSICKLNFTKHAFCIQPKSILTLFPQSTFYRQIELETRMQKKELSSYLVLLRRNKNIRFARVRGE